MYIDFAWHFKYLWMALYMTNEPKTVTVPWEKWKHSSARFMHRSLDTAGEWRFCLSQGTAECSFSCLITITELTWKRSFVASGLFKVYFYCGYCSSHNTLNSPLALFWLHLRCVQCFLHSMLCRGVKTWTAVVYLDVLKE